MKKATLLFCILAFTASTFSSCKKCTECSYTSSGVKYAAPEVCGSKKEVEDYEESYKATYALIGESATCVRK